MSANTYISIVDEINSIRADGGVVDHVELTGETIETFKKNMVSAEAGEEGVNRTDETNIGTMYGFDVVEGTKNAVVTVGGTKVRIDD